MMKSYKTILLCTSLILLVALPSAASEARKKTRPHRNIHQISEKTDIYTAIKHPWFNPKRTSIVVADAESGRIIAEYLPDLKLNPASCAKVVTSSAALAILSPGHRFSTDFFADRQISGGVVGTLYVAGTGNPLFINEEIAELAGIMHNRGLKTVTNGIVIDNSYFDSYEYPHKSTGEGRAYTAKTAATSVNFNSIEVEIAPGLKRGGPAGVSLVPPNDAIDIVNKARTGRKFNVSVTVLEEGGRQTVFVSGSIPPGMSPQKIYRSALNPALYAGGVIKHWLGEAGIKVGGTLREGRTPAGAVGILRWQSRPLSEIMKEMNKRSNNFIAEQTLKHLGAVRYGRPGSTAKGIAAVDEYLKSIGLPVGNVEMENGSGLSDVSRISAGQLVKVLVAAYNDKKIRDSFVESLSVLGVDGTTKKWRVPQEIDGNAFVKTGTIAGVSTLAGFAPMANGRLAAFAILANDLPRGIAGAHQAELNIVRAITEVKP